MIYYIKGNITNPVGKGKKVIIHICNNIGKWEDKSVITLSNKWPMIKKAYLSWKNPPLGMVQMVKVEKDIFVINMIAQNIDNITSIKYNALEECIRKVVLNISSRASIHVSIIDCKLAGGSWDRVEEIIKVTMELNPGVEVYFYDSFLNDYEKCSFRIYEIVE